MLRTRKYLICLLLALMLVGASSTFADDTSKVTNQITRETVDWSLSIEQCKKLKEPLKGTGEKISSLTTTELEGGGKHTVEDVFISGTASDSTGEYRYVYANRAVRDISAENSKEATKILMVDSFYMHGTVKQNWTKALSGAGHIPRRLRNGRHLTIGKRWIPLAIR